LQRPVELGLLNVLLDTEALAVTGVLDVGHLGVADRNLDLALLARSMSDAELNRRYGPALMAEIREQTGADPWRIACYCLLDKFF
jgi:aminoglycoside phosphotransferase